VDTAPNQVQESGSPAISRQGDGMNPDFMWECRVCNNTFSCLQNADRHRRGKHGEKVCLNPADIGMEIRSHKNGNYWVTPKKAGKENNNE
jgi:hypothetical protein